MEQLQRSDKPNIYNFELKLSLKLFDSISQNKNQQDNRRLQLELNEPVKSQRLQQVTIQEISELNSEYQDETKQLLSTSIVIRKEREIKEKQQEADGLDRLKNKQQLQSQEGTEDEEESEKHEKTTFNMNTVNQTISKQYNNIDESLLTEEQVKLITPLINQQVVDAIQQNKKFTDDQINYLWREDIDIIVRFVKQAKPDITIEDIYDKLKRGIVIQNKKQLNRDEHLYRVQQMLFEKQRQQMQKYAYHDPNKMGFKYTKIKSDSKEKKQKELLNIRLDPSDMKTISKTWKQKISESNDEQAKEYMQQVLKQLE